MKVKELIEKLQTTDPELSVFVKGYEGGYEDISFTGNIEEFALNVHEEWYYGPHDISRNGDVKTKEVVKGIVL